MRNSVSWKIEADACIYRIELLIESNLIGKRLLEPLMKKGDEILAIVIASIKTACKRA